ncbi:hypothetical protein HTZ77_21115 [Nonomuraea sp. SMC257]|uniref:Uncharacterized protein n=1 Tax=Nonomuraea montanisoli TaxID=2741721 RepID=A0A7Y6I906_9ACTN|nr:DUF6461 domain-containing protein [Nonomuraea montanisoli]NUW33913.1 hypothetical protein [Nonomuraea montanisoli]
MTHVSEEFGWLRSSEHLGDVYCVSFVRAVSPAEALRRFGVEESTLEEVTFEEMEERSEENADDAAGFVGAAEAGDWTLVVEPGGWRIAADAEVTARVSRATEVVSVCRHDYAADTFTYAVDGETIVSFDPIAPNYRYGSDPDRFVDAMREVGLDPDGTGADVEHPVSGSFALAGRITGVPFTRDMLALGFLGAEPAGD